MTPSSQPALPHATCPLCGGPNECAPAACGTLDTPCWCTKAVFNAALLDTLPADQRGRSCICARCAAAASAPATAGS
ncbi:MAG: cysteine-rich CWC family protein [Burkholderiales bacterium]|nr:cysteine-rich CWC family protein [Burkholderiales bacterium]